jgi:toxin ParE1/3/4
MRIEWSTLADADLKHIYAYISEESPKAAVAVLSAIRRAVRGQLATSPMSGRVGRVAGTRELVVPRLPYLVAYRIGHSRVQILRVLHGAQRWPNAF